MDPTIAMMNEALLSALGTRGMEKHAEDTVNEFTRTKVRENGFFRIMLPHQTIANNQLDRRIDTDKAYKIVDKEPGSPAAVTVPLATLPINTYIWGNRYPVYFDRVLSPRFVKDVDELRTYHMDIRQVLSDNSIKDMQKEEDSKFLTAWEAALIGPDVIVPYSGVAQWQRIPGGISRDSLEDAFKILPKTPSQLETSTVLSNSVTIREILKFGRDEFGGDKSQDLLVDGWTMERFMRARWIITVKRDLVPDDRLYMMATPEFVGKAFIVEDTTMAIKREAFMLSFYSYEYLGAAFGHTGGLAIADFD